MAALRVNSSSSPKPLISACPASRNFFFFSAASPTNSTSAFRTSSAATEMATTSKIIDSHLHVWASPQEALDKYPYVPGQEPSLRVVGYRGAVNSVLICQAMSQLERSQPSLHFNARQNLVFDGAMTNAFRTKDWKLNDKPIHMGLLLLRKLLDMEVILFPHECMGEAAIDGALIVQPINHKFDHSYVTSVLKMHPSKFVGCFLANPAEDGSGVQQLEHLILEDGYRAVRFNPYLWPSGQQMTNKIGKAMFSKAGELGVPVGFMCMKGLNLHISEIEELCSEFPKTVVLLDHLAFCKPPENDEEAKAFSELLGLSRFPQVYVKFSALFRVSRKPFPYEDLSLLLSQVVSSFGANRVMWGSDFPFVVEECGYKEAKEAVSLIANQVPLSSSDLEWIMGRTAMQLFKGQWAAS